MQKVHLAVVFYEKSYNLRIILHPALTSNECMGNICQEMFTGHACSSW